MCTSVEAVTACLSNESYGPVICIESCGAHLESAFVTVRHSLGGAADCMK